MEKPVKATSIKETETKGGIVEQVPEPAWLFYVLSFIIPIAGIIIGVIYLTKADRELKRFGKTCLVFAAIPIALLLLYILFVIIVYVLCILVMIFVMVICILIYLFVVIILLGILSTLTSAIAGVCIATL